MYSSECIVGATCVLMFVAVGAGCAHAEVDPAWGDGDTAAAFRSVPSIADLAPEGFAFAANGTHVVQCTGLECPSMWAETPASKNCGASGFSPREAYIIHQRGVDWDGIEGEEELHGQSYVLSRRLTLPPAPGEELPGTLPTLHNQSAVVQCCPNATGVSIAMKVCPDPCGSPNDQCPITLATGPSSTIFGACRTTSGPWQLPVPNCDLQVVDAGWIDPHAPHDLADPSGEDKRVFNIYYAPWSCGDGFCDPGEEEACDDDCAP